MDTSLILPESEQTFYAQLNIEVSQLLLAGLPVEARNILHSFNTTELISVINRCSFLLKSRRSKHFSKLQRNTLVSKMRICKEIIEIRNEILSINTKK